MQKFFPVLLLSFLSTSTFAVADEPGIKTTPGGTVTCTGTPSQPCKWSSSGGRLTVCQGSICMQIIESPTKTDLK